MGLIKEAPTFVAGVRCAPDSKDTETTVSSMDGSISIPSSVTTASQLREAIRFAEKSQKILDRTTLAERMEVVELVLKECAQYREEMAWGLAKFRGLVSKDSYWMCDLLQNWSEQVDDLVDAIWGYGIKGSRHIKHKNRYMGSLGYTSKGVAALITSSTMDGPPGIAAISHAILSGTHAIVRPSWKDVTTQFLVEVLYKHNLTQYIQMVRWPSSGSNTMDLNKQLIRNVKQAIVFCSDKTFEDLTDGFGEEKKDFANKIHKYGTGLPLVIVSGETDLERAAQTIFLGGRRGNGKFCLSHSPVLVHEKHYKTLLDKFSELSRNLKAGDLMDREVERGIWEPGDLDGLSKLADKFGGNIVQGKIHENTMDVLILEDVPKNSPCLYREYPGTLFGLIPYSTREEAIKIAQDSLKKNNREAWTAVNVFSSAEDYKEFVYGISSYHFLRGGVTSEPKFLLPHQGRYFAFDLTRRLTTEEE